MIKLTTIYQEGRPLLQVQLKQVTKVEQIITIVQSKLDEMIEKYSQQLSQPQLRVALPVIEAVRQSLSAAYGLKPVQNQPSLTGSAPTAKGASFTFFGHLDQMLAWLLNSNHSVPTSSDHPKQHATTPCSFTLDCNYLLDQLRDAIDAVDQVVAEIKPEPSIPKVTASLTLSAHGRLLEFLQEMLADAQEEDVQPLLKRIRQLPSILEAYEIQVITYQSTEQDFGSDAQRLFEFEPALDEHQVQVTTLSPAFVSEQKVLLRGRVVMPMQKEG